MTKMENNRPRMLEKFKDNRISTTSTDRDDKNENTDLQKTVPEVDMMEQFYQIGKYHSIPGPHTNLWKKHVQELLKSYQQLKMIMAHTKNPPYKKAFDAAVARL